MRFAFIITISLLLCTLLPAAAYSQMSFAKFPAVSANSSRPGSESVPAPGSDEIVKNAFKNTLNAKSYRAHGVMLSSSGVSYKVDQEFVAPNRMRSVIESDKAGTNSQVEAIFIGNDGYLRSTDTLGQWTKQRVAGNAFDFSQVHKQLDQVKGEDQPDMFEITGPDVVNGIPVVGYQSSGSSVTCKVWVGTKDNLVYKFEVSVDASDGKQKTTVTFGDYNADIKIEPPM